MKTWRPLIVLVILGSACGLAHADGMLLAPSEVLAGFSEQAQIAVVEVKPNHTVTVDLFISLLDTSGKSHEVHFLLPLQNMPEKFQANELSLEKFQEQSVRPLDDLFYLAVNEKRERERLLAKLYLLSSLPAGPCTLAGSWTWTQWHNIGGLRGEATGAAQATASMAPAPSLSLKTEHASIDVYRALRQDELAALARMPDLPESLREALSGYAGKPFALLRLRTQPVQNDETERAGSYQEPGIHLRFGQDMAMDGYEYYRYTYPLGTGQGWVRPILLTQVYVTAADNLSLEVYFPDRYEITDLGSKYLAAMQGAALGYAAGGRQVHMTSYLETNPREDVVIGLRGQRLSEFVRAVQERKRGPLVARIGFPLLGVFAWAVAFSAVVWHSKAAKQLGLWRALWRSWLTAEILLLPTLLGLAVLLNWIQHQYFNIDSPWLYGFVGGSAGVEALFLKTVSALGLAGLAGIVYIAAKWGPRKWRPLVWRSVLAAILAAVIYLFTGSLWLFRLLS